MRQSGTAWPGGRKVGKGKKSGKYTTFAVPRPDQPPLGLMFDTLMFSYLNKNIIKTEYQPIIIERQWINQTDTKS